ncbi:hypothetical protein DITRI_Ditri01bG0018200 [Diplodiscus trichospermus]
MKKKSSGRQKLEMAKIEDPSNLQVTFSKRRSGLFKKANELCTLCGTEVAILVSSPGNKVFSFGHPEFGKVIDRYLRCNPPNTSGTLEIIEAQRKANVRDLNRQLTELSNRIEAEKLRHEELIKMKKPSQDRYWWEVPIEELSLPELRQLKPVLEELKSNVAMEVNKRVIQNANPQQFIGTSSEVVLPNYQTETLAFDANMMPQAYTAPNMILAPPEHNLNPENYNANPQGYNPGPSGCNPNPQGYNPGPPGFGHGFF